MGGWFMKADSSTALRPGFPFTAVVGNERLKLALMLAALDTRLGGVLVSGPRGAAKSTLARGLAALLPSGQRGRLVTLPLGADEAHLTGTLDLQKALGDREVAFQPGLLARAHEGVLYIDEINLLPDTLIDLLLDVAASGVNRVERDGISHHHAADFLLIGTMNPDEGDLRPQLTDRFGLAVLDHPAPDIDQRMQIVERRLAFDRDPHAFNAKWLRSQHALMERLGRARALLPEVTLSRESARDIAARCASAGIEGVRADLAWRRGALAHAALEGRYEVQNADIEALEALVMAHRAPEWLAERATDESGSEGSGSDESGSDKDEGAEKSRSQGKDAARHEHGPSPESPNDGPLPDSRSNDASTGQDGSGEGGADERDAPPVRPHSDRANGGTPSAPESGYGGRPRPRTPPRRPDLPESKAGADNDSTNAGGERGAPRDTGDWGALGARPDETLGAAGGRISPAPFAPTPPRGRAPAARQRGRHAIGRRRIDWPASLGRAARDGHPVTPQTLRYRAERRRPDALECILLDTSGSALGRGGASARRLEQALDAVEAISRHACLKRHELMLIRFGGDSVETLKTPRRAPRSLEKITASLHTGGGTPLRRALDLTRCRLARRQHQQPALRVRLWIMTDARCRDDLTLAPFEADVRVIDCEPPGRARRGRARVLARELGADYQRLDDLLNGGDPTEASVTHNGSRRLPQAGAAP